MRSGLRGLLASVGAPAEEHLQPPLFFSNFTRLVSAHAAVVLQSCSNVDAFNTCWRDEEKFIFQDQLMFEGPSRLKTHLLAQIPPSAHLITSALFSTWQRGSRQSFPLHPSSSPRFSGGCSVFPRPSPFLCSTPQSAIVFISHYVWVCSINMLLLLVSFLFFPSDKHNSQ